MTHGWTARELGLGITAIALLHYMIAKAAHLALEQIGLEVPGLLDWLIGMAFLIGAMLLLLWRTR